MVSRRKSMSKSRLAIYVWTTEGLVISLELAKVRG